MSKYNIETYGMCEPINKTIESLCISKAAFDFFEETKGDSNIEYEICEPKHADFSVSPVDCPDVKYYYMITGEL